jgi:hypothetical protein
MGSIVARLTAAEDKTQKPIIVSSRCFRNIVVSFSWKRELGQQLPVVGEENRFWCFGEFDLLAVNHNTQKMSSRESYTKK